MLPEQILSLDAIFGLPQNCAFPHSNTRDISSKTIVVSSVPTRSRYPKVEKLKLNLEQTVRESALISCTFLGKSMKEALHIIDTINNYIIRHS